MNPIVDIDALRRGRRSPSAFGPRALLDYQQDLEPPVDDEGFTTIERVAFARADSTAEHRVLIVDVDQVLGDPIDPRINDALVRHANEGWILAGFVWRPQADDHAAVHARIVDALGVPFDLRCCPHPAGAPVCWCRPPMPGLVVTVLRDHAAAAARSRLVGATEHAERFAAAAGVGWLDARSLA